MESIMARNANVGQTIVVEGWEETGPIKVIEKGAYIGSKKWNSQIIDGDGVIAENSDGQKYCIPSNFYVKIA